MNREKWHIRLYDSVYSRPGLVRGLHIFDKVAVLLVAISFAYALFVLLFVAEYISALRLVMLSGIPFLVVSLMRSLINLKRPYEVFDIPYLCEMAEKRKKGHSFPSRHVFSAFLIGTLWLMYSPYVGVAVLLLGAFLALERVLLGIHFVKDVIAGAAIGLISGFVGVLIW